MAETRRVVRPGGILRVIGDFAPAVGTLEMPCNFRTHSIRVEAYFFGAANPILGVVLLSSEITDGRKPGVRTANPKNFVDADTMHWPRTNSWRPDVETSLRLAPQQSSNLVVSPQSSYIEILRSRLH